jgi:predicted DNA-binding WGR domain protein
MPYPGVHPDGHATLEPLRLERIDAARDMARYYTVSVELTLFEDVACVRAFGRIGTPGGRIMIGLFDSREAAEERMKALLRAKLARGYRVAGI